MKNIEKFNYFVNEINSNLNDPFGEEEWEEKLYFLIRAINQSDRIIYLAKQAANEEEALKKFKYDTGCSTEYGPLRIEKINHDQLINLLRLKKRRYNIISEELEYLNEEINELLKIKI